MRRPLIDLVANGPSLLLSAIRGGHLASTQILLQAGADPNRPTPDGSSPLQLALWWPEIIAELLKAKADPEKPDSKAVIAIQHAMSCTIPNQTLDLLLKAGAGRSLMDSEGKKRTVELDCPNTGKAEASEYNRGLILQAGETAP